MSEVVATLGGDVWLEQDSLKISGVLPISVAPQMSGWK